MKKLRFLHECYKVAHSEEHASANDGHAKLKDGAFCSDLLGREELVKGEGARVACMGECAGVCACGFMSADHIRQNSMLTTGNIISKGLNHEGKKLAEE